MSGDSLGYQNWEEVAAGIQWVDTRETAKHHTMHRTATSTVTRPMVAIVPRLILLQFLRDSLLFDLYLSVDQL